MSLKKLKNVFSNLATMESEYSIQNEPQEVDYMHNTDATGFSANQLGGSPSLFMGGTSIYRIELEPQEVDYMGNTNSVGFTANQVEGNASLFAGIKGTTWRPTTSRYTISNVNFPDPLNLYDDFLNSLNYWYSFLKYFDINKVFMYGLVCYQK